MPRRLVVGAAWMLCAAVVCSGCAGDGPAATSGGSSFDSVQQIFQQSCLDAGCHNSTAQAGGLVLEAGVSFGELVNVTPTNQAAVNAGLLRVLPNNVETSLLMIKLLGSSPYGSRMPLGKAPLSGAEIELIGAWINEGAPGPSGPVPTRTQSPTLTATAVPSETRTAVPTATISPTSTVSPSPTLSPTGTQPPTATRTPTGSSTPTASATASASATTRPTILPGSTLAEIQANIFTPTCMNEGCHNVTDQAGGQVLADGLSYDQLVGVTPTLPNAVSAGLLRVSPGLPDKSFLLTKVALPTAFDRVFASRMPQGAPALSATQIAQIRAWILRGALRDE